MGRRVSSRRRGRAPRPPPGRHGASRERARRRAPGDARRPPRRGQRLNANGPEEILSRSAPETERAGRRLGSTLNPRDVVYLEGDLGTGKTCFARGLAEGLGAKPSEVASPTFAIVNEYVRPDGSVALRHLDLYRVADRTRDLEAIGVPDALAGAPVAVEWPREAVGELLPPTVEVVIERDASETRRIRVRRVGG